MAAVNFPEKVALRVTESERVLIKAAAQSQGVNLNAFLRNLVLPSARALVFRSKATVDAPSSEATELVAP